MAVGQHRLAGGDRLPGVDRLVEVRPGGGGAGGGRTQQRGHEQGRVVAIVSCQAVACSESALNRIIGLVGR